MSKQKQNNFAVATVHELCPCCLISMNHVLAIPKTLSKSVADEIRDMDGKAIGISKSLCENCQTTFDKGYQLLVGIDPKRSQINENGSISFKEAYRTGKTIWLSKELLERIFKRIPADTPFIFVEDEVFTKIKVSEDKTLMDTIKENNA